MAMAPELFTQAVTEWNLKKLCPNLSKAKKIFFPQKIRADTYRAELSTRFAHWKQLIGNCKIA
jgi:hypothetical protein